MTAPKVRLHVGAHKTATTYIQETLLINQAASAAAGVAYWPVHSVRNALRQAKTNASYPQKPGLKLPWTKSAEPSTHVSNHLKSLIVDGYEVTISEENILGNPDDCYKGTFYRRAAKGLELLGEAVKDRPVEVMLAVRSYAPFLASMYSEALRHGMFTAPDRMMAANSSCAGQWLQVIDTIRAALPQAEITVWRYEDFSSLEGDILGTLSGLRPNALKKPSQVDVLPSASKKAIEQMIEEAGRLEPNARVFRMLALRAQYPRDALNDARFMPWPADDQARLQDEYAQDIAAIRARDDVTVLS